MRRYPVLSWRMIATVVVLATVLVRLAMIIVLHSPVESDAIAYLKMAEHFAAGEPMQDNFGQYAFYSAGYPVLLGSIFTVTGAALSIVHGINLVLAALTALLIIALVRQVTETRPDIAKPTALLAGLGFAAWIPAAYAATFIQKENLSTPLLLACIVATIHLAHGHHPLRQAVIAGLAYGAGLLTGGSTLLIAVLIAAALWRLMRTNGISTAVRSGILAALAVGLVMGPWLIHTHRTVGAAVLNTNGGFNLYLGNNPSATGKFVSIADTPMGAQWETLRREQGERGSAAALQREAIAWMAANPVATAELAARKLWYFWEPNIPDAKDFAANPVIASARWGDVAQFGLVMVLAGIAMIGQRRTVPAIHWLIAATALFWALHGAVYIITRYREPIMPLMIIMAAMQVALWLPKGKTHA